MDTQMKNTDTTPIICKKIKQEYDYLFEILWQIDPKLI